MNAGKSLVHILLAICTPALFACDASDQFQTPVLVSPTPEPTSTATSISSFHAWNCSFDRETYFASLLQQLGIPQTNFAMQVLETWADRENTRARCNPLATTLPAPVSTDFNAAGVQNYPDARTGIQATADTLIYTPQGTGTAYKAIRDMLNFESFNRQEIERSLNIWTGDTSYSANLVPLWQVLWNRTNRGLVDAKLNELKAMHRVIMNGAMVNQWDLYRVIDELGELRHPAAVAALADVYKYQGYGHFARDHARDALLKIGKSGLPQLRVSAGEVERWYYSDESRAYHRAVYRRELTDTELSNLQRHPPRYLRELIQKIEAR